MMIWKFADPPSMAAITTRKVISGGSWIAFVSHDADDGGWQFHDSISESPTLEDAIVVSLQEIVERDSSIVALADLPCGWRAWRATPTSGWHRGPAGDESAA